MRHLKAGRKFGRTSAHRKALFRNLVQALIKRERISTTLAKAKELRGKVEKTITLGKKGTLHARRQAFKLAPAKEAVQKVFGPLAERYANRPGGYTRIIRIGHRKGDDAPMAFIELVDREGEAKVSSKEKTAPKKEAKDTKPKVTEKKKAEPKAKESAPKKNKAPADKKKSDSKKEPAKKDKPEDKKKK
ncbi:MAG TPA: 50S ribosomal protein L17 [Nitrospinaceae bacterium]|jgi:large subunit ribosomal protein L17|nr:50S ribosomal protein L17 [Nitrospina sp.]HIE80121.1 50S ribosomal protein L17 [Nitrospinaceae bacterium]|tara:strand:- start:7413 stop:7979 length:567 start_codon:yes stop_codon:yes gene_type:complete